MRVPTKTQPKLFDLAVKPIQEYLAEQLPWLDHSFGIVEMLTDYKGTKKFVSANVYCGKEQYEQIMPCEELGNFAFWILKDPQDLTNEGGLIKSPFSLIFWYNVDKVSSSPDERNREAIKAQILAVLRAYRSPYLTMTRLYENPVSIFSDFSYDFTENQFLMHPFAGIRIDGTIATRLGCYRNGGFVGDGDFNDDFNEDFNR